MNLGFLTNSLDICPMSACSPKPHVLRRLPEQLRRSHQEKMLIYITNNVMHKKKEVSRMTSDIEKSVYKEDIRR